MDTNQDLDHVNHAKGMVPPRSDLEHLINTIDGIVWEGDAQTFEYYFVSKQAERILGYPLQRWINESSFWIEHIHPDDREWAVSYCALSTAQLKDHVFEYRMIAADGRVVWLRDIVTVVVENGRPVKLLGIMVDITENKRVEADLNEREQQYRSIFESVSDGLFINNLESGELIEFNPAAAHMHGYTEAEFRQISPQEFIHPDSLHLFEEYLETVRAGGVFRSRSVDIRKDGSSFHVEVTGKTFHYKGKQHTVAVVRDIDEQVKSYQLLEQRIGVRTRELQTLLEISGTISSTLDPQLLLELVLEQLKTVVDYTGAAIFTLEKGRLEAQVARGPFSDANRTKSWFTPDNKIDWLVIGEQQLVLIQDVYDDSDLAAAFRHAVGDRMHQNGTAIRSWMAAPLIVKDQSIGMIVLEHTQPARFSQYQADLVMTFSAHVAVAIENARLYKQSQELAALQERQKLARELHDSVSQALYGIGLGARAARKMLDVETTRSSDLVEPLEYVLSLAEAGLAEMRALIFELRPDSLQNEGLVAALSKQSAALEARHRIPVDANFCPEPDLSLDAKQTLYRIAQEGMNNIVKHASASHVSLTLSSTSEQIILEIRDDGAGFDPHANYPGHLGLRSMLERAERLGGQLTIESSPGQGSRVIARLPLTA
jgi:PAS domain S-box-containing protein